MSGAAGVIASGVGDQTRVDWKVFEKSPILPDFKFAAINHITCNNQSVAEGTACSSCRSSRHELLRRITQVTDLRQNPIKSSHNNCHLARAPTLLEDKVNSQANTIKKLRDSFRGKLYRKWSHQNGVSVQINSSSEAIFSDEVASNVDIFYLRIMCRRTACRDMFLWRACASKELPKNPESVA